MPVNPQNKTRIWLYISREQESLIRQMSEQTGAPMSVVFRRLLTKALATPTAN